MAPKTYGYMRTHDRFWEVDLLRTIAIVMMVTFHVLYLLSYLDIHRIGVHYGFWWWFARVAAGNFIFLAGVSLTISHSRRKGISRFLLRGLKIFALGMLITLLTWLIVPEQHVRFGILHFFGIAFILGPFFLGFRFINLIAGIALLAIGIYLRGMSFNFAWLLWLGFMPYGFKTIDYFPLLPWFGLFLVGMFCGEMLYPQGNRRFNIPDFSHPVVSALTLPGRHPLVIYLAHFPILIGVIFAIYPDKILPYIKEALSYLPF
jgi:uncharacterized membrane protein